MLILHVCSVDFFVSHYLPFPHFSPQPTSRIRSTTIPVNACALLRPPLLIVWSNRLATYDAKIFSALARWERQPMFLSHLSLDLVRAVSPYKQMHTEDRPDPIAIDGGFCLLSLFHHLSWTFDRGIKSK